MRNLDSISKIENIIFADKVLYSQGYGFSSSHAWSWIIKKVECQRIDAFELWCGVDS